MVFNRLEEMPDFHTIQNFVQMSIFLLMFLVFFYHIILKWLDILSFLKSKFGFKIHTVYFQTPNNIHLVSLIVKSFNNKIEMTFIRPQTKTTKSDDYLHK